jgi:serine/threonine-protein kinase
VVAATTFGSAAAGAPATSALPVPSRSETLAAAREWIDEDEGEYPPDEEPARRRNPWTWPLVVLLLLLLLGLAAFFLSQSGFLNPANQRSTAPASSAATSGPTTASASITSTTPTPTVTTATPTPTPTPTADTVTLIPEAYLGRPFTAVQSDLVKMGLQVKGNQVANQAAAGTVTAIDPAGLVAKGSTITVSYSKGPDMATVPSDLIGTTEEIAQQKIFAAGLQPVKGTPKNDLAPPGTVISVNPTGGTRLTPGSNVTYVLSLGPAGAGASPSVNPPSP